MDNTIHRAAFIYDNIKQAHNEKDIDNNNSGYRYYNYNCV